MTDRNFLDLVINANDLSIKRFPEISWAIPELIPEGVSILAGSPKIGKSWLVGSLAIACATGGNIFGRIPVGEPRKVLYLALEDSERRLQSRLIQVNGGDGTLPENLSIATELSSPIGLEKDLREWQRFADCESALVIVDTYQRAIPPQNGNPNYANDYATMNKFKQFSKEFPRVAIVLVHHTRKGRSDDFLDTVSGTQGLSGSADTTLVLQRERKSTSGLLHVTGRDVEENCYSIDLREGVWTLEGSNLQESAQRAEFESKSINTSSSHKEVLEVLNSSIDESGKQIPLSVKELASKTDLSYENVKKICQRLFSEGKVQKTARGEYLV